MPCWTRDFAIAAPIPTEAPVTRATRAFQRSMLQVHKTLTENLLPVTLLQSPL